MNLELTVDEAAILYSATIAFAEELRGMKARTSAMSNLSAELEKKERMCYELAQKLALGQ